MNVISPEQEIAGAEAMQGRVRSLAESTARHPAVKNQFYDLWMETALSPGQVEIFASNFYERVSRTPHRIALAFIHVPDIASRSEAAENLMDEMGHGNPLKAHAVLLRDFFELLLSRLRGTSVRLDSVASVLPSTTRLITEGNDIFSQGQHEAAGALLAQEWHAYPQLVYIYEGVRNYVKYFALEEFHENCEYFYLHIGATEKEHKAHSLLTAARLCLTAEDFAALERGFYSYLDLLAENWREIHAAIVAGD